MDIVESQVLMDGNTALLPQRGGRMREHRSAHRSVNITNLNPLPTEMSMMSILMTMVEIILLCLRAMLGDS